MNREVAPLPPGSIRQEEVWGDTQQGLLTCACIYSTGNVFRVSRGTMEIRTGENNDMWEANN
jgi:hypothetical protein